MNDDPDPDFREYGPLGLSKDSLSGGVVTDEAIIFVIHRDVLRSALDDLDAQGRQRLIALTLNNQLELIGKALDMDLSVADFKDELDRWGDPDEAP